MTNQPLAVLAKARTKLYASVSAHGASALDEDDREATATDLETAAAQYNDLRAKFPGTATCGAAATPSPMRTALEAAAFLRDLATGSNEADIYLAARISGRPAGDFATSIEAFAAAFTCAMAVQS